MPEIFDVGIIGSGPAGLTAGIYTSRGAASTLLLSGESWGGQLMLTTLVENYPGFPNGIQGPDLMLAMRQQAEKVGVKFVNENVNEIDITSKPFKIKAGREEFQAKSIIIATGAQTLWLNVPGEQKLIGRGVSSCAPCDAPFFKNKKVAVIGGGDSAMEEALVLEKFASDVTIIHRRNEFKASKIMQQKVLENKKIKIIWNTQIKEIIGADKVEKLILENVLDKTTSEFIVDGVFIAIGHSPSSKIFEGKIDLDEKGFIKKSQTSPFSTATSIEGVFVSGDVHDYHYKQAITAAGFGCMAALDVLKYLES